MYVSLNKHQNQIGGTWKVEILKLTSQFSLKEIVAEGRILLFLEIAFAWAVSSIVIVLLIFLFLGGC